MIVKPITNLINLTTECLKFPYNAKNAMVTPFHKKNSNLDKENYHPVSILPAISKIYERAINEQLCSFFQSTFQYLPFCIQARVWILRIIDDWKQALDENKYVAAILMDVSKAFDCLPHDLLLLKL